MTTNPALSLQLQGAGSGGRSCLTGRWVRWGCYSLCRRDSQPVPLQWQLYISRAFRKWSLKSQIFLQSPLSQFLIRSLGLSIPHKVQIFSPLIKMTVLTLKQVTGLFKKKMWFSSCAVAIFWRWNLPQDLVKRNRCGPFPCDTLKGIAECNLEDVIYMVLTCDISLASRLSFWFFFKTFEHVYFICCRNDKTTTLLMHLLRI